MITINTIKYICLLFLCCTLPIESFSQENVIHITPEQLSYNFIKQPKKPKIIQFWNPVCEDIAKIIESYKTLEKDYGKDIDFYFIAIVNNESVLHNTITKYEYTNRIYVADKSVNTDIYLRMETFTNRLLTLLNAKPGLFTTLFVNKDNKIVYQSDSVEISNSKLKKLL